MPCCAYLAPTATCLPLESSLAAGLWAPIFPKYVLLLPGDALRGALLVVVICALASVVAIRAALRVDPAVAIGG